MFNVFFRTLEGKNDYIVCHNRNSAEEMIKHFENLGYTNIRLGIR